MKYQQIITIFGETIIYGRSLSDAKVTFKVSTYLIKLNEGYKAVWEKR